MIVFANKQDLELAWSPEEIQEALKLKGITDRKWSIQAWCAMTKDGIQDGMEWLLKNLNI